MKPSEGKKLTGDAQHYGGGAGTRTWALIHGHELFLVSTPGLCGPRAFWPEGWSPGEAPGLELSAPFSLCGASLSSRRNWRWEKDCGRCSAFAPKGRGTPCCPLTSDLQPPTAPLPLARGSCPDLGGPWLLGLRGLIVGSLGRGSPFRAGAGPRGVGEPSSPWPG